MPTVEELNAATPEGKKLGTSPLAFAHAFRRAASELGYPSMDEAWLTAWFGKAIESGFEAAANLHKTVGKSEVMTWNDALAQAISTIRMLRR